MRKLFTLISLSIIYLGLYAQNKTAPGPGHLSHIDIAGYWYTIKSNNFFQIDLTPANPRIAGTGDQVVFYNSNTSTFNSIQVKNVYQYSDARAKKDIQPLSDGLYKVLNLSPVSYNWINPGVEKRTTEEGTPLKDIGFLAQDVEAIIPEAVMTDNEGKKLINYSAVIPYLVEAIKDLQSQIERLEAEKGSNSSIDKPIAVLSQNTPNPSHGTTTIPVEISQYATSASIQIYNLQGIQVKKINVTEKGKSEVQINTSDLKAGIYMYSLIVDNQLINSRRMVVTD
ncbi:tail fiber domain-containing protein [Parabacteroides segnis]|uniref:tail fiber domain-containing protein n=1 Tax=Parabacteroides segnis TaxID=2763058 RepID=UPI0035121067